MNLPIPSLTETAFYRQLRLKALAHRLLLQRLIVISAALLLSVAIVYRLPLRYQQGILLLPFLVAGMLILLARPPLGLIILILAAMLFKEEIIEEIGLIAMIVSGLAALWIFKMIVLERKIEIIPSRTFAALLALIITTMLAFIVGQLPWYPVTSAPLDAQIGGVLIFFIVTFVFLLAAHQIRSIVWLKWITFLFIGLGGTFLLRKIVPGMINATNPFFSGDMSGSVFYIWLTAMSLSQALFNKKLPRPWRILLAAVTVLLLYNVLFITRFWVSGWLPPLIALLVVIWAGSPRTAYIIMAVGAVIFIFQSQTLLNSFWYIGDNQYSQVTRLEAWRIIAEIVKVNPLLGLGPANYNFYTPLFPILGWFVQFNSHNNYVDMIAQTGFLGLASLLWFFWEMGKVLLRLRSQISGNGFVQAYIYGAVGGFAATVVAGMLGDWVIPYVYNITIRGLRASMFAWLFLGGVIAIEWLLKSGKLDKETGQEIYNDL